MINRCAVTIRAQRPFLDWVNALPAHGETLVETTLKQINHEPNVYLLPQCGFDHEQRGLLEEFCDLIFENELWSWWTDESLWPKRRDFRTFQKWFDAEFHSVVLDLVDAPLDDDGL